MNGNTSGRKRPWLAALLTILAPGLGHAYLREWGRAVLWLLLVVGAWLVLVPDLLAVTSLEEFRAATDGAPVVVNLALASASALCIADAYWMALNHNRPSAADPGPIASDDAHPDPAAVTECPSCGRELDADLDFCHWCTTPLDATDE